jgi:hypothetical protein
MFSQTDWLLQEQHHQELLAEAGRNRRLRLASQSREIVKSRKPPRGWSLTAMMISLKTVLRTAFVTQANDFYVPPNLSMVCCRAAGTPEG